MSQAPLIDLVIPLYNEEGVIADSVSKTLSFLDETKFPYSYRITLANNASTDGSRGVIEGLARGDSRVRVINLDRKGKGHAVHSAWGASDAEIVAFMDADLASDLRFLKDLVEPVVSGKS